MTLRIQFSSPLTIIIVTLCSLLVILFRRTCVMDAVCTWYSQSVDVPYYGSWYVMPMLYNSFIFLFGSIANSTKRFRISSIASTATQTKTAVLTSSIASTVAQTKTAVLTNADAILRHPQVQSSAATGSNIPIMWPQGALIAAIFPYAGY
mmetsp:Transcript_15392/g.37902  ORF Transcript_15392/g.37902 Transcript_15392/m.37902 type:complete len:150 (-) Transcript_15392:377-826(-)